MSHKDLQMREVKVKCHLTFKTNYYGNSLRLHFKTDEILISYTFCLRDNSNMDVKTNNRVAVF